MMSDGLFRDMLLWRGFSDISWKLKIMFVILYPIMVIVLFVVSVVKVIKVLIRAFGVVVRVIRKILGR